MNEFNEEEVQAVQTENTTPEPEQTEKVICKSAITLRTVGIICLVLATIGGFMLFAIKFTTINYLGFHHFNPVSLLYLLVSVLSALLVWALSRATADVADNTHKMSNTEAKTEKIVCKSAKTLRLVGAIILILGILVGGCCISLCGSFASGILNFLIFVLPSFATWAFARTIADFVEDIHIMAHKK